MIESELSSFGDFRLGDWLVQPRLIRIARGGSTVSIELKMMQVLVCLAKHAGDLVTRQELIDTVWATEFISEGVLTRIIAELRKALEDDAREPSYIETIHGRGYRLLMQPSVVSDEESSITRTVSHFLLVDHIGAGGMGVVYRAHDRRLDRDVAVKMLPEHVARDEDRRARFEREAKLLASLNHPHVATLHGLEEHEGQLFLVMEFAQGETLAERLTTGPIPIGEALPIALQIAQGLEAAHAHGIIHRDLKPANVIVDSEGQVKVLDFGLAKAFEPDGSGPQSPESLAESPTLAADLTRGGVLLGTAAYMSPEQARGKAVDKRADIWAFGCVLYEMLTGSRAFGGTTSTEILAAIIKEPPDWDALSPEIPVPVRRLLTRCLTKEPGDRLHDIADVRLEIEEAMDQPLEISTANARPTPLPRVLAAWRALLAAVAISAVLAGGTVWKLFGGGSIPAEKPIRLALNLPLGTKLDWQWNLGLAISHDGRSLVFAAKNGGKVQLYRRDLHQFEAVPIPGTEGADNPFFSPDGQWLGFFAGTKLKKVPFGGGTPQTLTDSPDSFGASWGTNGSIIFVPEVGEGLWRVPASGGTPEILLRPDFASGESDLLWPEFLPDGGAVLFTAWLGYTADTTQVCILDLNSHRRRTLIENASYARYLSSGHLIFGRGAGVHVVPFDVERREITGGPIPVPDHVACDPGLGLPQFAVSDGGRLAFIPGGGAAPGLRLVSKDLEGKESPLTETRRAYMYPRFSPDGERLAVTVFEPGDVNIWVLDLSTGSQTKLTLESESLFPLWAPDGERVTFASYRGGKLGIYWKRADGVGEAELLVAPDRPGELLAPSSWSPDGKILAFWSYRVSGQEPGQYDLWLTHIDGDRKRRPLVVTDANDYGADISPDGRWLTYVSDESGRSEIFVRPFPAGGERHQITTREGEKPIWAPDGQTIYYADPYFEKKIFGVSVSPTSRFQAQAPRTLFQSNHLVGTYRAHPNFDIAPDGKSFVIVKPDETWGRATEIRVVLNWFEELKRLAPAE